MSVSHIIEEVNLIFTSEESRANGMNGCITPSFVVESTGLVQMIEELGVRFGTPEV